MKYLFTPFVITPLLIVLLVLSRAAFAVPALEEIVVVASRIETPVRQVGASVTVIDVFEIELRGYQSVADVLRTAPSVAVSNSGGVGKNTAVRIRGEESYRTSVFIDGIKISDPTGTQVMTHAQHLGGTGNIERIEVLRGPQGFSYGGDVGGVINIATRTAETLSAELELQTGAKHSREVQGLIATGNTSADILFSFSDYSTDGFNARISDKTKDNDGYENTTIHAKAGWNISEHIRAQWVVRDTDAFNYFDGCYDPVDFSRLDDCSDSARQSAARVSVEYSGAIYSQAIAVSRSSSDREYFSGNQPGYASEGTVERTEYVGAYSFNPAITLVLGADYEVQSMVTSFDARGQRSLMGVFSEVQTEFAKQFYLSVGARFDDNKNYGEHVSVRVSPAYIQQAGTAQIKYRASAGTGFRAPSMYELAYNIRPNAPESVVNLVLAEESSQGADIGVEVYFENGLILNAGYFDQHIENEIYFDLINSSGYLIAEGDSHSKGTELFVSSPISKLLSLSANYTYNETQTEDDRPRVRRPVHLANFTLNIALLDEHLKLLLNARLAQKIIDNDGEALPDYTVLDLSSSYNVTDALQLNARIENLLDKNYVEVNDFNTAERGFYAGVKYTF